ncbi:MAG: hypothetical protein Q8Q39_01140 [bacterium]|nr:hypothetical protein [bacterium]
MARKADTTDTTERAPHGTCTGCGYALVKNTPEDFKIAHPVYKQMLTAVFPYRCPKCGTVHLYAPRYDPDFLK